MNNQPRDNMESVFNAFLAPSGMFVYNSQPRILKPSDWTSPVSINSSDSNARVLYNPYQPDVPVEVIDQTPMQKQTAFLEHYESSRKIQSINRSNFDDYALTLLSELVPDLVSCNYDVILFPLRGCRQPGILTKVIVGLPCEKTVIFNYTYATRGSQQELIRTQLIDRFRQALPGRNAVGVGVVDTAKGGNGSIHLAGVLADIRSSHFADQTWYVQFHLLHDRDRTQDLSRKTYHIPQANTSSMIFSWPILYPVDSLIVEDWDDGIGISTYLAGDTYEIKKAETPGRLIIRDRDVISVIESPDLSKVVTGLLVESVNCLILNDPDVRYCRDVIDQDALSNNP